MPNQFPIVGLPLRVSCILIDKDKMALDSPQRSSSGGLLVIAAVAFCVVLPFAKFGIPSGHDFEFHFNSWIEVVEHWKQGVLYPHWAAMAHYGYGEARFIFYPPASWTLGAMLGAILPWKLVTVAYIWIALTLSGCSMFLLARRWFPRADAIFAAAVYAANPYHLVIVYWRSAFAELLAAGYLPLLLLLVLRSDEDGPRVVAPLSLVMAAGWLTNLPAAVMMNYSLAVLLICVALSRRSLVVFAYGALAAILGAALAGFYLLPAFHQQSWVNIGQVLEPGLRPQESFLFTTTTDPDHNRFNLLISVVAVWQMALLGAGLFISRRQHKATLWFLIFAWSLLCTVLMLRFTLALWIHLPELRFVQFPWRWLLCLNVPFALAIVLSLRRWWLRGLVYCVAVGGVLLVWHSVQRPWWDKAPDIQEMVDNQHEGIGNDGADEYVPVGTDPSEIDQKAPLVEFEGKGGALIGTKKWNAELRLLTAKTSGPGRLILRLFNYPSWKVLVNDHVVETQTTSPSGQMVIPVAAGENRIQIRFVEGWDRKTGIGISVCALAILLVWFFISRRSLRLPLRLQAKSLEL